MKIFLVFGLTAFFSVCLHAQNILSVEKNTISFLLKLHQQKRDQDALYYMQHLNLDLQNEQIDSIKYIRSFCLMSTGQYQKSILSINKQNVRTERNALLLAFNYAHTRNADSAINVLEKSSQSAKIELFKSSSYLLKYDTLHSNQIIQRNINKDSSLQSYWQKNLELSHRLPKAKKSALVAGLLSAAVPGLGKIYAGQKKDGLSTLYTLLPFGFLVFENIYRSGIKKPQTIAFSSIFLVFYTGNIIGSIYSPKASYENQQKKFENEVLSNLYHPLLNACQP